MSSDRVIIDAIKMAQRLLWQNLAPTHNLPDATTVMRFRDLVRSPALHARAVVSFLCAPHAGGAYDSHHRTAGIAGRTRRHGGVAARGARAAGPGDASDRFP